MYTLWYNKYLGAPFKHLGDNIHTGIDCFNLCKFVIEQESNVSIPIKTSDFCNIIEEDWYNRTTEDLLYKGVNFTTNSHYWKQVDTASTLDIVIMSIGSTNISNHCALFIGANKILHSMPGHVSWLAPYGSYYRQYTTGIFRWTPLIG